MQKERIIHFLDLKTALSWMFLKMARKKVPYFFKLDYIAKSILIFLNLIKDLKETVISPMKIFSINYSS